MRWKRAGLVLVTTAALGGCVLPARDVGAYREDASQSVESAISEARTAQLALEAWLDGKLPTPYAEIVVTESEQAQGVIESTFGGVDPPAPGADPLRDAVTAALGDAHEAISSGRIAVRRGDRPAVRAAADQLERVGDDLQGLGRRLR